MGRLQAMSLYRISAGLFLIGVESVIDPGFLLESRLPGPPSSLQAERPGKLRSSSKQPLAYGSFQSTLSICSLRWPRYLYGGFGTKTGRLLMGADRALGSTTLCFARQVYSRLCFGGSTMRRGSGLISTAGTRVT